MMIADPKVHESTKLKAPAYSFGGKTKDLSSTVSPAPNSYNTSGLTSKVEFDNPWYYQWWCFEQTHIAHLGSPQRWWRWQHFVLADWNVEQCSHFDWRNLAQMVLASLERLNDLNKFHLDAALLSLIIRYYHLLFLVILDNSWQYALLPMLSG